MLLYSGTPHSIATRFNLHLHSIIHFFINWCNPPRAHYSSYFFFIILAPWHQLSTDFALQSPPHNVMNLLFHFHYFSDRSSRVGLASHVFVVLLVATELNRLQAKDNEVRNFLLQTRSSTDGSSSHRRLDVSKSLQRFTVNRPTKKQRKFVKTESAYNFQKGLSVSTEETFLNRLLPAKKTGNTGIRVTCSLPYSKANKKCKIELSDSTVSISDLTHDDREIRQKIEKNETLSPQMEFGQRNTPGKIPKITKNIKNFVLNDKVINKREIVAKVDGKTRKFIVVFPNVEILMDGIIHDYPFQDYVDDHQLGTFNLQLETNIFKQDGSNDYEINIKVMAIRNRRRFDSKSVIILKATQEQNKNSSEIGPGPKTSLFQIGKPIFIETEIAPNIINRIEIKQEELHDSTSLGKQKVLNENDMQINKTILTVIYNLTWTVAQPEETMPPFMYIRKTPVDKIIPIIEKSVIDQEKTFTNVQSVPGSDVINDEMTESNLKETLQPEDPDELNKTTNFEIDTTGHNDSAQIRHCPNCTIYTNTGYKNSAEKKAQAMDTPASKPDWIIGRKIAISAIPQKTDGEEDGETGKTVPHYKTFTTKIYKFTPSVIKQENSAEIEEGKTKTEIPLSLCNECPNEEKYWSAKVLKQTSPFPYGVGTDFLKNNTYPDDQPVRFLTTKRLRPFISIRIPKRPAAKNERLTSTIQPKNRKALYAKKLDLVKATKLPQSASIKLRLTTINPNEFIFVGAMPHHRNRSKMAKYSL
ncbi:uncharacterized protein LOC106661136 isoform X2 [Cimex lectularius]|uniref:Uncharacterized protein n=1 Tax=Cimex lectularius TaxID=79782 RepID=A0A8I6R9S3_CIMLE|nr:uncharacterized protein LOC106661136 isoform X2 [Cimex lectularius]